MPSGMNGLCHSGSAPYFERGLQAEDRVGGAWGWRKYCFHGSRLLFWRPRLCLESLLLERRRGQVLATPTQL